MRLLIQRVVQAQVMIEEECVGKIGKGLLILVGVGHTDTPEIADWMVNKLAGLRIFEDANGLTNLSLADVGGAVLMVSQFTLYADAQKGRRPSFINAAQPNHALPLFDKMVTDLRQLGFTVATGRFGTPMQVSLTNDGPFTIWLEKERTT
ncbi:MAG TPA: D-aminoacyl-tRNA deacylase [Anaerolineales bacterium]|nr:D-aminoacyl-tRNA deacylase [Anaerolineales bacterium]